MAKLGLPSKPEYVIQVSQESERIQQEMQDFLKSCENVPSAFIADNDIIAVSAIQVLQNMEYRVPEDVSIIGFDDSNICTILTPHLTTVKANFTGMARLATSRLIEMIEMPSREIIKSTVGTVLIKRQSVAPYSGR